MRRKLIAGNWKMNLGPRAGTELARAVVRVLSAGSATDAASFKPPQVVLIPPFVTLPAVAEAIRGSAIGLGAQDLHWERHGAFTGEVSGEMLVEVGCRHVLVGHSERRHLFDETDEVVARKARAALGIGLSPLICVGETLAEREAGQTAEVIERQIRAVFDGLDGKQAMGTTVAYEPVWAIGTGKNATPDQAVEVHVQIRQLLSGFVGTGEAEALRILYGGSVNPQNAAGLLGKKEIDGALVGGASLKAEEFGRLIQLGAEVPPTR